jgi:hypothetical protein
MDIKEYLSGSYRNREALEKDGEFSCYFCYNKGKLKDLKHWVDTNSTALCPRCGIDSILPGDIDPKLLEEICKQAFGKPSK